MSVREKIDNFYTRYVLGVGERPEDETWIKIPYGMIAFVPWGIFFNKFGTFFKTGGIFSLLVSLSAFLVGAPYVCRYGMEVSAAGIYCSTTGFWIDFVLRFIFLAAYAVVWLRLLSGEGFSLKNMAVLGGRMLKFTLLSFSFILLLLVPLVSLWTLYVRVPDPDWRIETAFFAFVSLGFFMPFVCVRFLSLFAFVAEGKSPPRLTDIWLRSRGNLLRIIFSLFLIFLGMMLFFNNFYFNFQSAAGEYSFYQRIFIEILYNFFWLGFFTLFLNHCLIQKKYLFDDSFRTI